jgi:hypothetical protein
MEDELTDVKNQLNNSTVGKVAGKAAQGIKFNKTRIKDFSEKALFNHEFNVKRILPLVEVEGLIFVTN